MQLAGAGAADGGSQLNFVRQAIERVGGSQAELGRRLSEYARQEITRQVVNGWVKRGRFPSNIIPHVHRLTGLDVMEMLLAPARTREEKNAVERALQQYDESPTKLAAALAKATGRKVTRQMVGEWRVRGNFPRYLVLEVHLLTKIPVAELMGWEPGQQ